MLLPFSSQALYLPIYSGLASGGSLDGRKVKGLGPDGKASRLHREMDRVRFTGDLPMMKHWTTPKTILKHFVGNCWDEAFLKSLVNAPDEFIIAEQQDFSEAVWHEAYVAVDWSRVTCEAVRVAAGNQLADVQAEDDY